MKKTFLFFLFICSATSVTSLYCMLSELKYKPHMQPLNQAIVDQREAINLALISGKCPIHPNIISIRNSSAKEKDWKCFAYAISQTIGIDANVQVYRDGSTDINIKTIFKQIPTPRQNSLVIYTEGENDLQMRHFAIVINMSIVESKWGIHPAILQHQLFDVPTIYGTAASFWILKKEFTTEKGKKRLKKIIQQSTILPVPPLWHRINYTPILTGCLLAYVAIRSYDAIQRINRLETIVSSLENELIERT